MIFGAYRVTGEREDLVKGLLSPSYTDRPYSTVIDAPTVAGTTTWPIGVVDEPGKAVRRFWVVPAVTSGVSATNYYTFKPFIVEPDGTQVYLGKARATNAYALTALRAFACHDEEVLDYKAPVGSVLGVEIVVVNGGTLVSPARLLLQAGVVYVG